MLSSMAKDFSPTEEVVVNKDLAMMNPSLELIEEARTVFGDIRGVSAFVSLGNGLSPESIAPNVPYMDGLPGFLVHRLSDLAHKTYMAHGDVTKLLEVDTYFRFDPIRLVEDYLREGRRNTEVWQNFYAYQQSSSLDELAQLTVKYLSHDSTLEKLNNLDARLWRYHRGETPALDFFSKVLSITERGRSEWKRLNTLQPYWSHKL